MAVEIELFPSSDFDNWASTYDQSVLDGEHFPFIGYQQALEVTVKLAEPQPGMKVLDIGTGTGNLALLFITHGCRVWGTDFSTSMLVEAKRKLPQVRFFLVDVRKSWHPQLPKFFERIVSGYVFHHFDLDEKVRLLAGLAAHLASGGRLVMADIAFPDRSSMEKYKQVIGETWEDEYYWLADETVAALEPIGLRVAYTPVSVCAGVFVMEKQ